MNHVPVLLEEIIAALAPHKDGLYVDATFGAGGYSTALLEAAPCHVTGIDRDPNAIRDAAALSTRYASRLTLQQARFGDMIAHIQPGIDGIVFDIGVSSMQLDQATRGFSFRFNGPLDMRMSQDGLSAADLVNETPEEELANLIFNFGEERHSRRIARAIVTARATNPITTTTQLAEIVRRAVPHSRKQDIDPATRTFQAVRIAVNDELGELERGLKASEDLLKPGGRLAVVTFHSLEDRIVKNFLNKRAGLESAPSRHTPIVAKSSAPSFKLLSRRPIVASDAEIARNPRARSAKLRAAERTHAAVWQEAA